MKTIGSSKQDNTIDKLGISILNSIKQRNNIKKRMEAAPPKELTNSSTNSGRPMKSSSTNSSISSAWKRALPRWSDIGRKWSDLRISFRLRKWARNSNSSKKIG